MGTKKNRLNAPKKHMSKLMNKKKITILCKLFFLNWFYEIEPNICANEPNVLLIFIKIIEKK